MPRDLGHDFRHAWRVAVRNPLVTLAIVATAAVGIAAATTMATVVRTVLVRPLPFPAADRIVRILNEHPSFPGFTTVNYQDLQDWRGLAGRFVEIAGYGTAQRTLSGDFEPVRLAGATVTDGLAEVLGIRPALGRFFAPEEFVPGSERVVVLGHGLWSSAFGSDPAVVGRSILLDDLPTRVIGVLPETRFAFPEEGADFWLPLRIAPGSWQAGRGSTSLSAIGRLRPGVPLDAARAEIRTIAARLAAEHPETNAQRSATVESLHALVAAPARPVVLLIGAATALVLFVAAGNVALLLLARARQRRQEFAVRAALGGGARILRLVAVESLLLSGAGGVLGGLAAGPLLRALLSVYPGGMPRAEELRADGVATAAAIAVTVSFALGLALVPAWSARRTDPGTSLRSGERRLTTRRRSRTRDAMVVGQIALAVVLLAGAAALLRTFLSLSRVDPGFDAANALAFSVAPPAARYPNAVAVRGFYDALIDELRRVPGATAAGTVANLPFGAGEWVNGLAFEGQEALPQEERPKATVQVVDPGYLEAMGIPVERGRGFTDRDRDGAPRVALVSASLAAAALNGDDVIGRRFTFLDELIEVVGVVGDIRYARLDAPPGRQLYITSLQHYERYANVVVRVEGDPGTRIPLIREALRRVDPAMPLADLATMDARVAGSIAPERFRAALVVALGSTALLLALLGVYALVANGVLERRHEIGVRLAIGQTPRGAVLDVLRDTLRVNVAGCALGLLGALAGAPLLRTFLFDAAGTWPALLAVPLLLTACSLVAASLPARRAAAVDPMTALRD